MVADTEDAPAAVWPVAGENRGAWKEAAAAAGSDAGESQETVGGLWRASQRWVAVEIFRKISVALASSYVAYVFYEMLLSSICNVQNFSEDAASCLSVTEAWEVCSLTSRSGPVQSIPGHYPGSRASQLKHGHDTSHARQKRREHHDLFAAAVYCQRGV